MIIKLYNTTSPNNKVNKTLDDETFLLLENGTLREETNVEKPSITIKGNRIGKKYNYAYIPDFGRYYYITSFSSVRNGLTRINLEVDPLMSFASDIKNLKAIISKQQTDDKTITNKMYNDGTFQNTPEEEIYILRFPHETDLFEVNTEPYYILTCI